MVIFVVLTSNARTCYKHKQAYQVLQLVVYLAPVYGWQWHTRTVKHHDRLSIHISSVTSGGVNCLPCVYVPCYSSCHHPGVLGHTFPTKTGRFLCQTRDGCGLWSVTRLLCLVMTVSFKQPRSQTLNYPAGKCRALAAPTHQYSFIYKSG